MVKKITYSNKIKNIIVLLLIVTIGFSHPVVQNLDIERFMGRWYVISIIPNWFEDGKNAYDDYVLNPDGTVGVTYYAIKNGEVKKYKDLLIKSMKCKNSEFDDNPEITAYLQVQDLTNKNNDDVYVFNGWMFSSSPSITPFDHPVYDIWLVNCY